MDVLFVGLGSIGTRHLKNLHAVAAQKDIPVRAWALRSSARALPEETRALLALLTDAGLPEEKTYALYLRRKEAPDARAAGGRIHIPARTRPL